MHVDHELVEFVPADEQDYDKVIEEYEEEILVQEGVLELSSSPLGCAQQKPPVVACLRGA